MDSFVTISARVVFRSDTDAHVLIDSTQLESDDALDPEFRDAAAAEIEQFKREIAQRDGAAAAETVADKDLLREVMNTVGKWPARRRHPLRRLRLHAHRGLGH